MPNNTKISFLAELTDRFGALKKLPNSLSLYEVGEGACRLYIRYSRVHPRNRTFYGIRKEDLDHLEGFNSLVCFLWDSQDEPLFLPYSEFAEVFGSVETAADGQFKVQVYPRSEGTELYIANAGRFNVEPFIGWDYLRSNIDRNKLYSIPDYSHSQIQTLLGSIGSIKGYDVWIPSNDRMRLDWSLTNKFSVKNELPERYSKVSAIIKQIDVLWLKRGSTELTALFEVEHSTSIYSGLLRFNDLHLIEPNLKPKFSIVSNEVRRSTFVRQIGRPTFRVSGLYEVCSFLDYKDVYGWFNRSARSDMT